MTDRTIRPIEIVSPVDNELHKEEVKYHRRTSIIQEFASTTTAHGLPNLSRSTNTQNRLFWTISSIAFTTIMIYFVARSIIDYFNYPTQTSVSINLSRSQKFPAVSICNISPVRFDNFIGPFINFTDSRNLTNTNDTNNISFEQAVHAGNFVMYLIQNNLLLDQIFFSLESMLISCSYNGRNCSTSDFSSFLSSTYGRCYTFNAQMKSNQTSVHSTVDYGGLGSLDMRFYIHSHQYVPYVSDDIAGGLVALIHDNTELPFVDIAGVFLEPGRKHKVLYTKKMHELLPSPYSNCTDQVSSVMQSMFDEYGNADYSYSQIPCYVLCMQAYLYDQCGCVNPMQWISRAILKPGTNQIIQAPLCDMFDPCYFNALARIINTDSIWNQYCYNCPPECSTVDFLCTYSAATAPSSTYQYTIKQFVENSNVPLPKNWSTTWQTEVKNNYVALLVVCESNKIEDYSDSPSVSGDDLLSNIGGQSGLWIGISFLSIMELVEMFYRLIRFEYHHLRRRILRRN